MYVYIYICLHSYSEPTSSFLAAKQSSRPLQRCPRARLPPLRRGQEWKRRTTVCPPAAGSRLGNLSPLQLHHSKLYHNRKSEFICWRRASIYVRIIFTYVHVYGRPPSRRVPSWEPQPPPSPSQQAVPQQKE